MPDLITKGVTQSFDVAEQSFGMTAHALMVPPFPMRTALFLGYGRGNVAALVEKIWPVGCEFTGVDIAEQGGFRPDMFFKREAWQFVEWSQKIYDFVCVDLYHGSKIPKFVFSEKFVDGLAQITGKMLAVNATFSPFTAWGSYGKHFEIEAIKRIQRPDDTED